MSPDVVIVGGGIAGLATGYELHRRNVSFLILERASRAGGVILSEEIDGYTIDAGPDSLLISKPEGVRLCNELGLGERLVSTKPPRLAYVQRAGRLYALPSASVLGIPTRFGPFARTGLFSWRGKLRMGAELFVAPRQEDTDESVGSFMRRRFGHEATAYLAEPLLAGIHAGDVDRLSIRALFPRFVDAEREYGSLIRAFRRQERQRRAAGPATERHPREIEEGAFKSLPGGLSEMVRALVRALPANSIRLNAPVTRIDGGGTFHVETADGRNVEPGAVVLAAPAYITSSLVREVDAELARLCNEITYVSTGTVALAFTCDQIARPLDGSGFVVPRVEGSGILAATWLSSKWPNRSPEGRVLIRTFVGGMRDPAALERSDAELVALSLAALRPLVGLTGDPLVSRVYRWERANAQHEVGHLDRLAAIERRLQHHPGLFVTGSGFRGVGIPDCVADGRATAKAVADWLATKAGTTEVREHERRSR